MSKVFPIPNGRCIPFRIGDGESMRGSRLGGLPPDGVAPGHIGDSTRYFCTLRLEDDPVLEVSVFISFDFEGMADAAGILHSSQDLLEVIVHNETVRCTNSSLASELTPHPIVFGPIMDDCVDDGAGNVERRCVRADHKLGGVPYMQNSEHDLADAIAKLMSDGFFQVAQFDFPGIEDGDVNGDWPFGGGAVHLFGREPLKETEWRFFWEY